MDKWMKEHRIGLLGMPRTITTHNNAAAHTSQHNPQQCCSSHITAQPTTMLQLTHHSTTHNYFVFISLVMHHGDMRLIERVELGLNPYLLAQYLLRAPFGSSTSCCKESITISIKKYYKQVRKHDYLGKNPPKQLKQP